MHAVRPQGDDLTELAILDPLVKLDAVAGMAEHQADAHLEVPLDRLFGQRQHFAAARAVNRGRLLHEYVHAFLDGIGEVYPTKRGRCRQHDHVARPQAVDGLLIGVETDKLSLLRHVNLAGGEVLLDLAKPDGQAGGEDVGQGDQLDRTVLHGKRSFDGPAATTARTHDGHLNRVVFGGVDAGNGDSG